MNIREFLQKCLESGKLYELTGIEIGGCFYNIQRIDDDVIDEDIDDMPVIYAYDLVYFDDLNVDIEKYEFTLEDLEKQEQDIRFTYDKYINDYETFLRYDIN